MGLSCSFIVSVRRCIQDKGTKGALVADSSSGLINPPPPIISSSRPLLGAVHFIYPFLLHSESESFINSLWRSPTQPRKWLTIWSYGGRWPLK